MTRSTYLKYFDFDFTPPLPEDLPKEHIVDLFALEFGKLRSRGVAKLIIQFVYDQQQHLSSEEFLDVMIVKIYFDRTLFSSWNINDRKCFLLHSIWLALDTYAGQYGWDRNYCQNVYQHVLDSGMTLDRWWGKPVLHGPSQMSVQAHVHCSDTVDFSLGLFDRKKRLLKKRLIARSLSTLGTIDTTYGKLEWLDQTLVRLWDSNKRDYWDWNIETDQLSFHYPRAERGDPHGQYDFARMYLAGIIVPRL